jgi:hypothetical protein
MRSRIRRLQATFNDPAFTRRQRRTLLLIRMAMLIAVIIGILWQA